MPPVTCVCGTGDCTIHRYEEGQREDGWSGVRLAALCIGVGAYDDAWSNLCALNACSDAVALFKKINECADCRAAIVKDPDSRITVIDHLTSFLDELAKLPADELPEVVLIFLAGHGMQSGSDVFLIPTKAKCKGRHLYFEDTFLSHLRVLEYLHDYLDRPARDAHLSTTVKFVVILDMCRDTVPSSTDANIEPGQPRKAPFCWSICYSTSKGCVAGDATSQGRVAQSPLAFGLLHAAEGIFAPGVSLKQGIENACKFVPRQSGVGTQQCPVHVNLDFLKDFFLRPQEVSEGAGSADTATFQYKIVEYLKRQGLARIAERLSEELGLEEIDDLTRVQLEEIDELYWLKPQQRMKFSELLDRIRQVTARLMPADDIDSIDLSADDTTSQGASSPLARSVGSPDTTGFEADSEDVLVVARNVGDCSQFQEHMTGLMRGFFECFRVEDADPEWETFDWGSSWTLCMLLWIRFAHDATLDQRLCDKWLHATTHNPNQDQLLSILTECLASPGTAHPLWTMSGFISCECRKEHAAGIFFTDMMVEHAMSRSKNGKQKWRDSVVQDWFHNDEPVSAFLSRANKFLSEDMEDSKKGMSICESVVETHSYVVFMTMSRLAASLLFGYLEAHKLNFASTAGAADGGRTLLLHGFTSFVSSEGHAFSLSKTGMPALHDVVQGLQGLVHLAHTCWEVMGPVKTAQEFLLRRQHQAGDCREEEDVMEDELDAALRMSMEISAGTALIEATKVGNLSEVKGLLARPDAKDFLNATDEDEESPMYRRATSVWWATRHGINVQTSDGTKYLEFAWAQFGTRAQIAHVAAVLCDPECADQELRNAEQINQKVAIVKRGANTFGEKARRAQEAGALALIIINSDNELFAVIDTFAETTDDSASPVTIPVLLVAADAGATLLQEGSHVTLVGSRIDILQELIGAGADVNLASQHRRPNQQTNVTPISIAAADGHTEAIRALIMAGADPNIPSDPLGFTAIHWAAQSGHAEAITALIQGGADPNIFDKNKHTPFSIAATNKHSEALEALLEGGADPDSMAWAGRIYLTKGVDAGRNAWWYVLVEPRKIPSFLAALNNNIIHLDNYGQILKSGYGETPPAFVTQALEEFLGTEEQFPTANQERIAEKVLDMWKFHANEDEDKKEGVTADQLRLVHEVRPVCTAKDFLYGVAATSMAAQEFLLQDDRTIDLDALVALSLLKKDDGPLEDGSDDNGSAAELHDENRKEVKRVGRINAEREKRVRDVYADKTARSVIETYLEGVRAGWGSYVDSASGEEYRIDGQAISLLLLKSKCFEDMCDSDDRAKQEDLICPISRKMMQDPVKCSDGHTYERKYIEKWAHENGTSPKTREILKFDEQGHVEKVCCHPNTEILEKIKQFKEEKRKEREDLKQSAEGEEEKQILRSRLGYKWRDGDRKEGLIDSDEEEFQAAEKFLHNLLKTGTGLACLTGPPASGKTVTMQKIVCTHAATQMPDMQMEEDGTSAALPIPLLPLFMRASELSKQLSETGKDAAELSKFLSDAGKENMTYLVELFLDKGARQELFSEDVKDCILKLFHNDHVLICIDGLDEAAPYQDLVEDIIDKHVAEKSSDGDVRMLISTREHSYVISRKLRRLADFDVVKLQPLDKGQQLDMIQSRLIRGEQVDTFLQQLAGIADKNPELAASPFLLSLMIEVYKNDGSIPSQRVKLYAKQVKAIVLRCIATRTKPVALEVATDYLEILAFVCQVKRSQRDFSLAVCADDVKVHWKHSQDDLDLARDCLFGTNIVGLLTCVGQGVYRFSHLTLQEYLAATCTVRLFGHDTQELLNQLQPLFSLWKRMVVQFAACLMEDENVFAGFCQLVLASDDGTGSHCELVQDFLKERDAPEKVEQMVRDKLQEIRGSEWLIAGLCHPSPELRNLVLSEMKKFGVPPDPFAEMDGTAAALRQIAEDGGSKWHKRAAALLSLAHMAQMDHCRKGNGRSDTLQWLLGMMLKPDQNEDIGFALVKGLGTLLKVVEQTESRDGIMLVAAEDEPLLLGALKQSANGVVVEAVADLKAYSDGLMDWVSNESSLIAEGVWPMRHLLHVFCIKTATSGNQDRAEKLGQQLFGRVHAVPEDDFEEEQGDVLKGLDMICQAMRDDRLPLFLNLLESGEVKQRSRVMQVAAELGMQFVSKSRECLDTLAQALLSDVVEGCTLADLMDGGSLLAALLRDESDRKHESLRQSSNVFGYLMESFGPAADQGLEAPKRVVDFLVEFEKNHLAAATAATRTKAEKEAQKTAARHLEEQVHGRAKVRDPVEKWNVTVAVQKSEETNPEEKRKEDKKHSEHLSLESLAVAVEDFTPRGLSTRIRRPEKPLKQYCAARLWAASGLMQERTSEEIAACLSLSEALAKEAEDAFSSLQVLKEPWVSGHGCKDGRWLQNVLEGMRDETQCLGIFVFTSFLEYIRERQCSMKDMSWSGIEEIEEQVEQWQPSGARGQLEKQLLLKEVRIGRRSQELPSWTGVVTVPQSTLNRIDAFFVETGDRDLDLPAEAQLLTRIVEDPGCGWDCRVHLQPTIEDLYKSIKLARQRNMRVLHLAGRANEEGGFIWNADDEATSSKTFDVEDISLAIGAVAGQQGPLECVVLNACCTEEMGRLLRQRGVPNVVCWQTPVRDETARELCERFFRALVEEKQAGKRDYKQAFFAATDAMRSFRDGVSTAEQEEHSGSSRHGHRGIVKSWKGLDVLVFLSNDGDSEPVYLWHDWPLVSGPFASVR